MKNIICFFILLYSMCASASQYKVFVGTPPGSGSDIQTRKLFDEVSKDTGDTFIILNKPGASFLISYTSFLEEGKSDNSIIFNTTTLSLALANKDQTPDLKSLVLLHKVYYYVAVRQDSKFKTLSDLRAINIGSTSLVSELLVKKYMNGMDYNLVPYKSENESTLALLKGEVDAISTNSVNTLVSLHSDKLRKIQIYPHSVVGITGYSVSNSFPEKDKIRLNTAINKVMRSSEFSSWFRSVFNVDIEGGSPERYDEINNATLKEIFKIK